MKIQKVKKMRGGVSSTKLIAGVCLLGSVFTFTHYSTEKDYLYKRQASAYEISNATRQLVASAALVKSGNSKDFPDVNLVLKKIDDLIFKENDSLTSMIIKDPAREVTRGTLQTIKASAENVNRILVDMQNSKASYMALPENKNKFRNQVKDALVISQRLMNNSNLPDNIKIMVSQIYKNLTNAVIFDKGDIFSTKEDLLNAQKNWLNTMSENVSNMNNLITGSYGSKINNEINALNTNLNSIILISNDFVKITEINSKGDVENQLVKLSANINKDIMHLIDIQDEVINSQKIWLYISIGLALIMLICAIISMNGSEMPSSQNSRKEKKLALKYKEGIRKVEKMLGEVFREQDKSISKEAYNKNFTNKSSASDNHIFGLKNKIDKVINVIFSLVETNKLHINNLTNLNTLSAERCEEVKRNINERRSIIQQQENNTVSLINSLDTLEIGTKKIEKSATSFVENNDSATNHLHELVVAVGNIRDNTQDTSKRIKRLGESTQSLGGITDDVKELSKQIEVLALRIAIESPSNQENNNREISLIAKEIQRLTKSIVLSIKKIDDVTASMKEDAKQTVSSMEKSTEDVINGANIVDKTSKILSKTSNEMNGFVIEVNKLIKETGANKNNANSLRNFMANIMDLMQEMSYYLDDVSINNKDTRKEIADLRNETLRKVNNGLE